MAEKTSKSIAEMIKLGLVLVVYAVISCTVLAVVNNFTAPRIKINQIEKANNAMKAVFPEADNFVPAEGFTSIKTASVTISDLYFAKKGDSVIGGAVQVEGPTYDRGKIIVGVNADGTISGVRFLQLSDSPGFGLKANDPTFTLSNGKTFYGQFDGKECKDGFVAGENYDAISGATITSVAVAELINQGSAVILDNLGGF